MELARSKDDLGQRALVDLPLWWRWSYFLAMALLETWDEWAGDAGQ